MTTPEPMSPEIERLLAHERARPGPDAAALARLKARVIATAAGPGGGGGSDGGAPADGTAGAGAGAGAAAAGGSAAGAGSANTATAGAGAVSAASVPGGAMAVIAFLVGGAVGGGTVYLLKARPNVVIQRPAATPAPIRAQQPRIDAARPDSQTLAKPAPDASSVKKVASPRPKRAPVPRPQDSKAEQRLIDMARNALARRSTEDALTALASHKKRFPRGRFKQEREGLRVIALARSGQRSAAQAAAKRFLKRYPRSLLAPAVRQAVSVMP